MISRTFVNNSNTLQLWFALFQIIGVNDTTIIPRHWSEIFTRFFIAKFVWMFFDSIHCWLVFEKKSFHFQNDLEINISHCTITKSTLNDGWIFHFIDFLSWQCLNVLTCKDTLNKSKFVALATHYPLVVAPWTSRVQLRFKRFLWNKAPSAVKPPTNNWNITEKPAPIPPHKPCAYKAI